MKLPCHEKNTLRYAANLQRYSCLPNVINDLIISMELGSVLPQAIERFVSRHYLLFAIRIIIIITLNLICRRKHMIVLIR